MSLLPWDWIGDYLRVKVLYSVGGIANQILLSVEDQSFFLLDVGDGILRDLISLKTSIYENIQAILISHGHFDHVGGLFSLLAFYRLIKRNKKLTIISPPQVQELIGLLNVFTSLYKNSIPYAIEHIEIKEIPIVINQLKIKSFQVVHKSSIGGQAIGVSIPAVGYSIQYKSEVVVYTGDTGYFEELKNHIRGANLALIEGTYKSHQSKYHMTINQAKMLGKLAKHYIILHKQSFSQD
ncbi:MAG: MBL fold metallo-hydrolase [Candidatus Heimdallarchaeaceae archaeon]